MTRETTRETTRGHGEKRVDDDEQGRATPSSRSGESDGLRIVRAGPGSARRLSRPVVEQPRAPSVSSRVSLADFPPIFRSIFERSPSDRNFDPLLGPFDLHLCPSPVRGPSSRSLFAVSSQRDSPSHRTAPHRTSPHFSAPHRTAPHRAGARVHL